MTNPKLQGLSVMYRALSDEDRSEALSLLSSMRYAPHLQAIPDVFAIIPSSATQEQADNISRGLLEKIASNLTGDVLSGDYDDAYQSHGIVEGDGGRKLPTSPIKVSIPTPVLSVVSMIRGPFGGAVPEDMVGVLNIPGSFSEDGKYTTTPRPLPFSGDVEYDIPLEGGLFSKLKKIASGAMKVVSAVKTSPIGNIAMKALKVVPGVGSLVAGAELAMKALPGASKIIKGISGMSGPTKSLIKSTALSTASAALGAAATKEANKFGDMPAKQILGNPDVLIQALDQTFGPQAVNDAIFQILAAEGDFVDDVVSGTVLSGPALSSFTPGVEDVLSGDWTQTAKDLLASTMESFQGMADKTKTAGASAFSKLDPRVQTFLNNNWGKLAGGTAGVAGSAALYYGVSKYMKEKDAEARLRVLQAKREQAEKAAAAQRASLEASRKRRASQKSTPSSAPTDVPPYPSGGAALPPMDTTSLPNFGGTSSTSDGPSAGEVSAGYIKVPFGGTVLADLQGAGKDLFNKWQNALLSVNPAMLTGDLPRASYDDFGAVFLLHGFPISSVNVAYTSDLSQLEKESGQGHALTSPYLTKRVIEATMRLLDPRADHSNISVKVKGGFKPWTDNAFILDPKAIYKIKKKGIYRHLPVRFRKDIDADLASNSEANHALNAVRFAAGDDSIMED